MNNIRLFFKMVKYEMIRIFRNKVILLSLFLLPLIVVLLLSTIKTNLDYNVAILWNGLESSDAQVVQLIEERVTLNNIINLENEEDGLKMLARGDVNFVIVFDPEADPVTATFYYDNSSETASYIKDGLRRIQIEYAYSSLTDFLSQYGIVINESYFNLISFEPLNNNILNYSQRIFAAELGTFLAIVLMFGLAFSLARDNETGVSRQISYMPLGVNRYLLSKIFPYFVIGIVQTILTLFIGRVVFNIEYQTNVFVLFGVVTLFSLATLALGALISTLKNQIAAAFLSMFSIMLPVFAVSMAFISSFPVLVQALLYLSPITAFIDLFHYMIFNGVILWRYIIILFVQIIVYYIIVLLIMRKRSGR